MNSRIELDLPQPLSVERERKASKDPSWQRQNQAEIVRELVGSLRANPFDEEAASVLADWCEERGFDHAAAQLRSDPRKLDFLQALASLQNLFGYEGQSGVAPRYSAIFGFPSATIRPLDDEVVETAVWEYLRVRKLVLPSSCAKEVLVTEFRIGKTILFSSGDPIDAEMFGPFMCDLFDYILQPQEIVRLVLQNTSRQPKEVHACVLGERIDPTSAPEWLVR